MRLSNQHLNIISIILRIGIFGTFLGHGLYAFGQKEEWIPFLTFWGFNKATALQIMPVIGVIDILIALIVLIRPLRPVLVYAFLWALITALMRPITGQGILEFVERSANWAAPLALLMILQFNQKD